MPPLPLLLLLALLGRGEGQEPAQVFASLISPLSVADFAAQCWDVDGHALHVRAPANATRPPTPAVEAALRAVLGHPIRTGAEVPPEEAVLVVQDAGQAAWALPGTAEPALAGPGDVVWLPFGSPRGVTCVSGPCALRAFAVAPDERHTWAGALARAVDAHFARTRERFSVSLSAQGRAPVGQPPLMHDRRDRLLRQWAALVSADLAAQLLPLEVWGGAAALAPDPGALWQQRAGVLQRDGPLRPRGLALEELVARGNAAAARGVAFSNDARQWRLVRLGESRGDGQFPVREADVRAALADGFTFVVHALQSGWRDVTAVALALERRLGAYVSANLYMTPPGAQGIVPHWDDQEVFVLQVAGSKHWVVREPMVHLPRRGFQGDLPEGAETLPLLFETVLRPGDVLYIPAGTVHYARGTHEGSTHVTFAAEIDILFSWEGALRVAMHLAGVPVDDAAMEQLAHNTLQLRKAVPLVPERDAANADVLRRLLDWQGLRFPCDPLAVLARMRELRDEQHARNMRELWADLGGLGEASWEG